MTARNRARTIVVLPGDGIGPEVVTEAVRVLREVEKTWGHDFRIVERLIGGHSIDRWGSAILDETLAECRAADAVLLGAVGGPRWDDPGSRVRPEQGLLALRSGLGVFANLRPVTVRPALADVSPLKAERLRGVDFLIVRELTGGLYFGEPRGRKKEDGQETAVDTLAYSEPEIRRVVSMAFRLAHGRRKKVTSVDKANVLESSRLWRQVAVDVAHEYPEVQLEHMLVDTAAMRLITNPQEMDVVVTENTFGDILADEAAVLAGSLGMLPSASLGESGPGLYEPVHGSAPDIAGQGIANPIGCILSAALLLRHSLGLAVEANAIERAVDEALGSGCRTPDLGGKLASSRLTDEIIARLV
jgi:3-isopropylmalate dehydrogenase